MSLKKSSRGAPKQIDKNTLLVAQEITFAKILSGNDPKLRERGIKRLQKWLTMRSSSASPFKENDLKRIWKGLFYCMWMSDKPLIQEEVAENISKLVHCFNSTKAFACFVKCFFLTMAVEWRGLDSWRMDKFLMFVRRFIRQIFVYCDEKSWSLKLVNVLGAVFNCTILPDHKALSENVHPPVGFSIHFVDIYIDELTKVCGGRLENDDLLVTLLRPFALYLSESPEIPVSTEIVSHVFDRLIEQSSEGHQFREKFEAWKQLGFPRGTIDAVEKVDTGSSDEEMEDTSEGDMSEGDMSEGDMSEGDMSEGDTSEGDTSDGDGEEGALDPRAGGVNVELPVANYNPQVVVNLLREYRYSKTSTAWSRKVMARVMSRFNALTEGKYPLGIKKVDKVPKINFKKMALKSAKELLEFRDEITHEDDDEWMERICSEKSEKGKNKSAQKNSKPIEDDESEPDDDLSESDDIDENGELDSDENGDVGEDQDIDEDSDEDIDEDVDEDDEDVDESDDSDGSINDGSDNDAVVDSINNDDDVVENCITEESTEEENLETEVDVEPEEPVKLTPRNRNKKNKLTPEKRSVRNLPRVIPLGNIKKRNQASEEQTPEKKSRKSPRQVISNGISTNLKNRLEEKSAEKEEKVIIVGRKRKLSEALSTPLIHRGKHLKSFKNSPKTPQTPGSSKKVHFILQRNTAQATSEYDRILKENPGNPYDSAKKPRFSVLKTTPLASPVNPFYKR